MASLTACRLHGAAIQSASPLGPGRALTLPCGWNNAGRVRTHENLHEEAATLPIVHTIELLPAHRGLFVLKAERMF